MYRKVDLQKQGRSPLLYKSLWRCLPQVQCSQVSHRKYQSESHHWFLPCTCQSLPVYSDHPCPKARCPASGLCMSRCTMDSGNFRYSGKSTFLFSIMMDRTKFESSSLLSRQVKMQENSCFIYWNVRMLELLPFITHIYYIHAKCVSLKIFS